MAETFNFIEYTPETAQAIRNARDLHPNGDGNDPWPDHGRQAILPPPRGDVSAADVYDGPFALSYNAETKKVDVKAGFLNRNGEWKTVAAASVDPETGYVCVVTQLNDEGEWTDPELAITEPGLESYPVGYCTVTGSGEEQSVTVSSFRVPVAVFLISAVCSTDN